MRPVRLLARAIHLVRTTTTTAAASPGVLKVGDVLRERRRFTEGDVAAYAGVSGDRNPVHLDDALAREVGGFDRGRVVHGMLVASLFPSLIASHFVRTLSLSFRRTVRGHNDLTWSDMVFRRMQPGAVYASQSLKFAAPVYIGDEVLAQLQALHIRAATTTTRYMYVSCSLSASQSCPLFL